MLGAAYKGEVYRIENDRGFGPYSQFARTYEDPRFRYESSNLMPDEAEALDDQIAPDPHEDFSAADRRTLFPGGITNKMYQYGFPSIEMMRSWFPESILRGFAQNGFVVKKYTINSHAFLSTSRRQIAFYKVAEGEVIPWSSVFGVPRDLVLCDQWGFPRIRIPKEDPYASVLPQGQLATVSGDDWCLYQTNDKTIVFHLNKERAQLMQDIQLTSAVPPNYRSGSIWGKFNNRKTFFITTMDKVDIVRGEPQSMLKVLFDPSVRAEDNILKVCSRYHGEEERLDICKNLALGQEYIREELKGISIPNTDSILRKSVYGSAGNNVFLVVPMAHK